jgi:hypothetical protein
MGFSGVFHFMKHALSVILVHWFTISLINATLGVELTSFAVFQFSDAAFSKIATAASMLVLLLSSNYDIQENVIAIYQ